jgi:hypothetical protein
LFILNSVEELLPFLAQPGLFARLLGAGKAGHHHDEHQHVQAPSHVVSFRNNQ